MADTRISRATESQDTWTRELRLVVPVSDPARWSRATELLQRTLNFLTGDRWHLGFRARPRGFERVSPKRKKQAGKPAFDSVNLFSGGLDSLIGAIDALEDRTHPFLVSHAGDGATSAAQTALNRQLKTTSKALPLERLRVWVNFPKNIVRDVRTETTTRGRSFLFFALGVLAGSGLPGTFTLRVPENGFISLNVPLDPLRLGSHSTRTTHPFYIARWNDLLAALGIAGRIVNPYWDKTKGEMVAGCTNQLLLKKLAPASLSCAAPTKGRWHKRGVEHCGFCLPCLIRRAALNAAWGPSGDPTAYTLANLTTSPLSSRRAEGKQIRSFQFAIDRLRATPGLERLFIHKPGPLSDEQERLTELAAVHRRGMAEVGALLDGVETTSS
jgi:hypothetical protein